MEYDRIIKTIIIGDAGVGKTSLCHKLTDNYVPVGYNLTIGVDFFSKIYEFNDYKLKLHIWDTAGQERFHSIIKSYFREAELVILMFDYSNPQSFDNLELWLSTFYKHCLLSDPTIIVIGNKTDLPSDIDINKVNDFVFNNNYNLYSVSLKRDNFEETFYSIIQENFYPFSPIYYKPKIIDYNLNSKQKNCCTIL